MCPHTGTAPNTPCPNKTLKLAMARDYLALTFYQTMEMKVDKKVKYLREALKKTVNFKDIVIKGG